MTHCRRLLAPKTASRLSFSARAQRRRTHPRTTSIPSHVLHIPIPSFCAHNQACQEPKHTPFGALISHVAVSAQTVGQAPLLSAPLSQGRNGSLAQGQKTLSMDDYRSADRLRRRSQDPSSPSYPPSSPPSSSSIGLPPSPSPQRPAPALELSRSEVGTDGSRQQQTTSITASFAGLGSSPRDKGDDVLFHSANVASSKFKCEASGRMIDQQGG